MKLGSFGSIVFQVSGETLLTWKSLRESGQAVFARHAPLGGEELIERIGRRARKCDLDITLHRDHCDIDTALATLNDMENDGQAYRLLLGNSNKGKYALERKNIMTRVCEPDGSPRIVDASLSLIEYVERT